MEALESKINYRFKDRKHLIQALTHSSYGYEHNCPYNERLEFLGDAILGFVVSRELFLHFPDSKEGTLSKIKSVLVSAFTLAKKAETIQLGSNLRLGKGEKKANGKKKPSILADAMEALIGAISMDGGFKASEAFIKRLYEQDIANASLEIKNKLDFKTLLQERLQEYALNLPKYETYKEEGPAHNRRFQVRIVVDNYHGPIGVGTSKKTAQQDCARQLLEDKAFWSRVSADE